LLDQAVEQAGLTALELTGHGNLELHPGQPPRRLPELDGHVRQLQQAGGSATRLENR